MNWTRYERRRICRILRYDPRIFLEVLRKSMINSISACRFSGRDLNPEFLVNKGGVLSTLDCDVRSPSREPVVCVLRYEWYRFAWLVCNNVSDETYDMHLQVLRHSAPRTEASSCSEMLVFTYKTSACCRKLWGCFALLVTNAVLQMRFVQQE